MVNRNTLNTERNTQLIKSLATEAGFSFTGISKAEFLENQAPLLDEWLKRNYHGQMGYMANHFDKRLDPRLLVPGAQSVVSLLYNYYPEEQLSNSRFKVSKYAYGDDYHTVIKDKLFTLLDDLRSQIGDINGRVFVDSAPVMDKVWAAKSGLGWVGKHTNLINKQEGSWFFIAEIISDLELIADGPIKDYCGTCTRCIDACPTDAIVEPYVVDGSKCISYLTIELKDSIPAHFKGKMENWAFGCDICQDVCPWNRFAAPHQEPRFMLTTELKDLVQQDFEPLTEELFQTILKNSPISRTKFSGLKRNVDFIKG